MSQSRQLAAIMFTDIAGYTALMGEDEQLAFELLKKNRSVQRPIIEKFGGRWLKEIGDGVLASFSTVTDAVYCAIEIQNTCKEDPELNLRIGIHQGEVVFEGDDVFGDGVNIASRLEALAPVGGILISESVHNNLTNKKNVESSYIGEKQLRNVKKPVKVYQVYIDGIGPVVNVGPDFSKPQAPSTTKNLKRIGLISLAVIAVLALAYFFIPRQSPEDNQLPQPEVIDKTIAVLPFKNDSPDADNQYFADGMMDEILNHMQKIAELGVKSRTAVEPYRNSTQSFATIAQELEVAFILEGAVRKYGDRFRITTQLIEVASGNHLWSDTYDGTFSDTIFVVQSNIAKKIASSLNTVITADEEKSIDRIPTTDIAAYDLWVRASHEHRLYWRTLDNGHLKTAHDLLESALKIDPEYLMAVVGKGEIFSAEGNYDSALVYAARGIGLAPDLNMGYGLAGSVYMEMNETDLAMENYLKAIHLPPQDGRWLYYHSQIGRGYLRYNEVVKALPYLRKGLESNDEEESARPYFWLWAAYTNIGDYEKAEIYGRKAAELACFGINTVPILLFFQGKFQEAFQFADSTCIKVQCESFCFIVMFRTSYLLGEYQNAEQFYLQSLNVENRLSSNLERLRDHEIGYVYYQLGRTEEAEKIFAEQIKRLESDLDNDIGPAGIYLARIYAFLGEKDKALDYLKQFVRNREFIGVVRGWYDFILFDPFFESLRDDPEFKAIVKQAQDEKAALREQVRQMEERGELTL